MLVAGVTDPLVPKTDFMREIGQRDETLLTALLLLHLRNPQSPLPSLLSVRHGKQSLLWGTLHLLFSPLGVLV